jgi:hypothetical protein
MRRRGPTAVVLKKPGNGLGVLPAAEGVHFVKTFYYRVSAEPQGLKESSGPYGEGTRPTGNERLGYFQQRRASGGPAEGLRLCDAGSKHDAKRAVPPGDNKGCGPGENKGVGQRSRPRGQQREQRKDSVNL